MDSVALQRIAAAVTPAVMVSACGLLALGLDNQAARMTLRLRELAKEYRSIAQQELRRRALRAEVRVLSRRHGLYVRALVCVYGALLSFLLTSTVSLAQSATESMPAAPLVLFAAGVALLAAMSVFTLLAVALSRRAIVVEERSVLEEAKVAQDPALSGR